MVACGRGKVGERKTMNTKRFPKRIYVREELDRQNSYLVIEEDLSADLDGATLATYELVSVSKLVAKTKYTFQPPKKAKR